MEEQKPLVNVKVTFVGFGKTDHQETEAKLKLFGSRAVVLGSGSSGNALVQNNSITPGDINPRDPRLGRKRGCYFKYPPIPDYFSLEREKLGGGGGEELSG